MNTDVLVSFVLDRSGSMHPLQQATVEGFNQFVEQQQGQPGEAFLSLLMFDDQLTAPLAGVEIAKVPQMGSPELPYNIGGSTALYDAVGTAISGTEAWLPSHPFAGKVIIAVWTDGFENASTQWKLDALMKRVKEKQNEGWEFSFLGTGGAAWTEGQNFQGTLGAANTTRVAQSAAGMGASFTAMSAATTSTRTSGQYMGTTQAYKLAEAGASYDDIIKNMGSGHPTNDGTQTDDEEDDNE